jgi:Phage integrase family
MAAARKSSRYGHRDATMILIAYRHGLRASEVCDLQWHQVELAAGRLHVRRSKRGTASVHPLQGDELRALRRLQRPIATGLTCASFCPGTPPPLPALACCVGLFAADRPRATPALAEGSREGRGLRPVHMPKQQQPNGTPGAIFRTSQ